MIPSVPSPPDYSDIFPASLNLSDQHISKLVRFWEVCRRPELSSLSPSKIPKSPPRSFSLMSTMRGRVLELYCRSIFTPVLPGRCSGHSSNLCNVSKTTPQVLSQLVDLVTSPNFLYLFFLRGRGYFH